MTKHSIFFRILFPVLGLLLLCTVTVSTIIYSFAQRLLYEDVIKGNGALLVQINGNFSNLMQQLNTVISVSDSSLYFRSLLTEPCESPLDQFEKQMELHRFLSNYYSLFTQYKAHLTVVGKNGIQYTTYDGERLLVGTEALLSEAWAAPLRSTLTHETIVSTLAHAGITSATEGRTVILFARNLIDSYTMEQCGWMFLEIDPAGLAQVYRQGYSSGESVFITDHDGRVISGSQADLVGSVLEGLQSVPAYPSPGGKIICEVCDFNTEPCLAVKTELSAVDGYIVKYIAVSTVSERLNIVLLWIIVAAVLFCFAADLFSFLIFRRITRPLVRLSQQMASTRYGQVKALEQASSRDEIETLERTFSNLLAVVDAYTENIRSESNARHAAELNALRMQINPHFLYNTLSSIRYLLENGCDRARISEAIGCFISLLRGTISNRDESIPLAAELDNLRAYITLMNLRYDGRIHLNVFLNPPALGGCLVPKLILQPVVENAIFHGYPNDAQDIDLTLYISENEHVLRIEIADSGCGIGEEVLQAIRNGTYQGKQRMTGVGLNNISQRLQLIYGPEYGLEINSAAGMGTIVTLQLPVTYGNEGESI